MRLFNTAERAVTKNKERDEIRRQSRLYGLTSTWMGLYKSYGKVRLASEYKEKVLQPFAVFLKNVHPRPTILDIGAGLGEASKYLEACGAGMVIRLDVNEEVLVHQKTAVRASAWALPFKDGSITGIHMKDAITHIPPKFRAQLFAEIKRVLVPEGKALIVGAEETLPLFFQFPVSRKRLLADAVSQGLILQSKGRWRPNSAEGDWYDERSERFVLMFKNPSHESELKTASSVIVRS